jgi:hypothetical protein
MSKMADSSRSAGAPRSLPKEKETRRLPACGFMPTTVTGVTSGSPSGSRTVAVSASSGRGGEPVLATPALQLHLECARHPQRLARRLARLPSQALRPQQRARQLLAPGPVVLLPRAVERAALGLLVEQLERRQPRRQVHGAIASGRLAFATRLETRCVPDHQGDGGARLPRQSLRCAHGATPQNPAEEHAGQQAGEPEDHAVTEFAHGSLQGHRKRKTGRAGKLCKPTANEGADLTPRTSDGWKR